jgi:putative transcriptional regulator
MTYSLAGPSGPANDRRTFEDCKADLTNCIARSILNMESELDMAQTITNRVKELRSERAWTQQQLAEAVGVSRQSINSIERNRYVPSLPLALKFAEVFECATDAIFTLEEKPS